MQHANGTRANNKHCEHATSNKGNVTEIRQLPSILCFVSQNHYGDVLF